MIKIIEPEILFLELHTTITIVIGARIIQKIFKLLFVVQQLYQNQKMKTIN